MSDIALDRGDFFASPLTEWYRQRPFRAALAGSLFIHAALLAAIPGLRAVSPETPQVLNVEIVKEEAPAPVLERRAEVPPPVMEPEPRPVVEPLVRPEPRPVEPELQVQPSDTVRPEPAVRQSRPEMPPPPPQPAVIQAVPRPERHPDAVAPPNPVEPRFEPRTEIRPEAPPPSVAPQQPAIAQPRVEVAAVPQERPHSPVQEAPQVAAPPPPQPPAQPVAVPKAAVEAERTLVSSYEKSLSDLIKRHEKYPERAMRQRWEGTAVVGLSLSPDGKVMDVAIVESSGREILDDAALNMVRRASPLPRAPEGLRGKERLVRVPIVFKLQS
jgi:protein TonB